MSKWIITIVGCAVAALFVSQGSAVVAQVRAALVQDVHMQGFRPFHVSCSGTPVPGSATIACTTATVPPGNRLVIEHISGSVQTLFNGAVYDVVVNVFQADGDRVHFVPFERRRLDVDSVWTFGSPARMYVPSGASLRVSADGHDFNGISMMAIGYLVLE